mmetsp:Transcript_83242/g.222511  ORF Transcript_83242/g.222511 Transcript_83242/m.222511 type:complete len:243 (+) Transcript_83242:283-1011(+)
MLHKPPALDHWVRNLELVLHPLPQITHRGLAWTGKQKRVPEYRPGQSVGTGEWDEHLTLHLLRGLHAQTKVQGIGHASQPGLRQGLGGVQDIGLPATTHFHDPEWKPGRNLIAHALPYLLHQIRHQRCPRDHQDKIGNLRDSRIKISNANMTERIVDAGLGWQRWHSDSMNRPSSLVQTERLLHLPQSDLILCVHVAHIDRVRRSSRWANIILQLIPQPNLLIAGQSELVGQHSIHIAQCPT